MSLIMPILMELRHEAAGTRKVIERMPESEYSWKPHPKSMSVQEMISHLAQIPFWGRVTVEQEKFEFDPTTYKTPIAENREEALRMFDENLEGATRALEERSDEYMMQPWSLIVAGHTAFTLPRIAVIRSMVMNHMIHHRAQLTVYLRLKDIAVPALYGPSADEK